MLAAGSRTPPRSSTSKHTAPSHVKLLTETLRRHLVRFWLRDPERAWKTPVSLQDRWDRVYSNLTAENQVFPLEPSVRT